MHCGATMCDHEGMDDRPEQPPEGKLLTAALKRTGLSQRKAADKAAMSEGHWRAIATGSRSVNAGVWISVRAPADTLARMARVVEITPEQLEDVGRSDAAEELRLMASPDESRNGAASKEDPLERLARLTRELNEVQRELREQAERDRRDSRDVG